MEPKTIQKFIRYVIDDKQADETRLKTVLIEIMRHSEFSIQRL